ncbi:MAG: YraN family protein [Selenomonadaceae bacterium]
MNTKVLGDAGEMLAAEYLQKKGCRILKKKFRAAGGEIDLIVCDGDTLAFVEVKSRRSTFFGSAAAAVNQHKQQKIARTAEAYLQQQRSDRCCRFDVVEVYCKASDSIRINWLKNAFEMD